MITVFLKTYRTQKGFTQEELATLVGVSRQTIISIEKGTYLPSLDLAYRLSELLDVPITQLFTFKK